MLRLLVYMANERLDKTIFKRQFQLARKKIFATETVCGICGKPVDFDLKFPHPLSACVDHIIPVNKGGHYFAPENLQLAHLTCNRFKSDKITEQQVFVDIDAQISNRNLPLHYDWFEAGNKK